MLVMNPYKIKWCYSGPSIIDGVKLGVLIFLKKKKKLIYQTLFLNGIKIMNFINLLYIVKFGKTKNLSNKYIFKQRPWNIG